MFEFVKKLFRKKSKPLASKRPSALTLGTPRPSAPSPITKPYEYKSRAVLKESYHSNTTSAYDAYTDPLNPMSPFFVGYLAGTLGSTESTASTAPVVEANTTPSYVAPEVETPKESFTQRVDTTPEPSYNDHSSSNRSSDYSSSSSSDYSSSSSSSDYSSSSSDSSYSGSDSSGSY